MLLTKKFKKHQFLFTQGESAREMYLIIDGKVKIMKSVSGKLIDIAELGEKSFLGEVAMFRNDKHGSNAIAETDVEVAVINKETFQNEFEALPSWFQTMIKTMAERLHSTSIELSYSTPGKKPDAPTQTKETKEQNKEDEKEESPAGQTQTDKSTDEN
jgi:CRP/FNR family transcriptional regulator